MQNPVRVEIVPCTVEADDDTMLRRAETVQRMVNAGMIDDASAGRVNETVTAGWTARINGVAVPAVTFGVEPVQPGQPVLVSLLIPADEVSIGVRQVTASPVAAPPQVRPASPEKPPLSTWGSAGKPDPRENIPGWKPQSLGEQVAANAAAGRLA